MLDQLEGGVVHAPSLHAPVVATWTPTTWGGASATSRFSGVTWEDGLSQPRGAPEMGSPPGPAAPALCDLGPVMLRL